MDAAQVSSELTQIDPPYLEYCADESGIRQTGAGNDGWWLGEEMKWERKEGAQVWWWVALSGGEG